MALNSIVSIKTALIVLPIPVLAVIVVFFALGLISQSGKANGLTEGKLAKCADKSDCICSEYQADITHYIEPMTIPQSIAAEVLPSPHFSPGAG